MTPEGPPPEDPKQWSKNDLVREVHRLRAILREHAERSHDAPRSEGTSQIIDVAGDPHARGGVILDVREAVLLEAIEVTMMDAKREDGATILGMSLAGRVNFQRDRSETLFLFDEDGAAAIVSQLLGLAMRMGPEFVERLTQRVDELP